MTARGPVSAAFEAMRRAERERPARAPDPQPATPTATARAWRDREAVLLALALRGRATMDQLEETLRRRGVDRLRIALALEALVREGAVDCPQSEPGEAIPRRVRSPGRLFWLGRP